VTIATLLLLALWSWAAPGLPGADLDEALVAAVEWRESRGNATASSWCCHGVMQVHRAFARVPVLLLYVPQINRLEGRRILRRWRRTCRAVLRRQRGALAAELRRWRRANAPSAGALPLDLDCAIRAYNTGTVASRDPRAARRYLDDVLGRYRKHHQ